MHDSQNFFDIDSYHEFIQRQLYVDNTHPNPPLLLFEPFSNLLESQSQNASSHFEIHNDEGDYQETIDTQDTRKKSDVRGVYEESYKIRWKLSNYLQLLLKRVQVVEIRRLQHILTTYQQYSSHRSCEIKGKGSNANFQVRFR